MTATLRSDPPRPADPAAPAAQLAAGGAARRTLLAYLACALAAVALKALFRDTGWLATVWTSMAVVLGPAVLLRIRREAAPWHVWPGLALLVPWLTAVFVPQHAIGHVIPTAGTWHDITALLTDLHRTSAEEIAPIHSTPAVRLVLCAMLGLLTALVDLVAVVGRHGALGGIPLLVVYTVAGAVPRHAVPWPLFAIAAAGYLILLALDSDEILRNWGRRITRPGDGAAPRGLSMSAFRVGVVAVLLATTLPAVIPSRHGNLLRDLFSGSSGGSGGFGTSTGSSIDPFVALRGQLTQGTPRDLFTVHLTSRGANPFYARVNVLSVFSNDGWRRGGDPGVEDPIQFTNFGVSPSDQLSEGRTFHAEITISGLRGNPPVFVRPTEVDGVGPRTRWSQADQLLLNDDVGSGQKITETWTQPNPTVAQLTAADGPITPDVAALTAVPDTLPQYVRSLVAQLTHGRTSSYGKALAIYSYFTDPANGFVYTLQTKAGDSGNDLVDFLQNKQGFCQQYAAAMGVLLRAAGIPARVVLGYTHETPDSSGTFTVTTGDAHSWVEAYFPGIGWTPFDPTPLAGITGGAANDLSYAPHPRASLGGNEPTKAPVTTGNRSQSGRTQPSQGSAVGAPHVPGSATGTTATVILLCLLGLALVGMVPAGIRELRRRRRLQAAVRRRDPGPLWAELADCAADLGYVWSPARSPRQVAEWLARDAPTTQGALRDLANGVERARYARTATLERDEPDRWIADLVAVTRELRGRRQTRTRLSARFWPASVSLARRPRLRRKRH